jgi:mannose-6-phosphate isomerase-like protein (cupin superfamily)
MTLPAGESIGLETHPEIDQCIFVIEGEGQAVLNGEASPLLSDEIVCIPAGTEHDILNTSTDPMRLFTIYGPPQHPPGTVHATRAEAEEAERNEAR